MWGGYLLMDDEMLEDGYLIQGRITLLPKRYIGFYGEYGLGRGVMLEGGHYSISPACVGSLIIYPYNRWLDIFVDIGIGYVRSVKIISVEPVSKFSIRVGGGVSFFQNIRYPIYFGCGFYRLNVRSPIDIYLIKFKLLDNMHFSFFIGYNL
ncbi:MAG: hypothetical protein ACUVWP_04520 [bacterium]